MGTIVTSKKLEFSAAQKTIIDNTTDQPAKGLIRVIRKQEPEGIFNVNANVNANVTKRIVNGQLVIVRDGATYNMVGAKLK